MCIIRIRTSCCWSIWLAAIASPGVHEHGPGKVKMVIPQPFTHLQQFGQQGCTTAALHGILIFRAAMLKPSWITSLLGASTLGLMAREEDEDLGRLWLPSLLTRRPGGQLNPYTQFKSCQTSTQNPKRFKTEHHRCAERQGLKKSKKSSSRKCSLPTLAEHLGHVRNTWRLLAAFAVGNLLQFVF